MPAQYSARHTFIEAELPVRSAYAYGNNAIQGRRATVSRVEGPPVPELGKYGSVRGARGNSRPYRDH